MKPLGGVIPVLATPFDDRANVDIESFERQIATAIQDGAAALTMFGLASEYYKLTDSERRTLIDSLFQVARHQLPVVISVTHHSTEIAVRQACEAQDCGAAAIMILPPFFLDPPPEAILEHVENVAAAVNIPVILQYAPAQTGISPDILARTPVRIVKIDAVPYVPAAAMLPQDFVRFAGYMGLDLPDAVTSGCQGVMPTASLVPHFRRLWDLLQRDPQAGRELHNRLTPLLRFMMQSIEFLNACEKHLLVRRKIFRHECSRRPRTVLSRSDVETLDRHFNNL